MQSLALLNARMYLTLFLVFAIGFSILYLVLFILGASAAVIIVLVLLFFMAQWYFSPTLIARMSKLKYISNDEHKELHEMVESLAKEAKVPAPKIAISPSREPNAFVFGRTRKNSTLVVHQGLLDALNANELRAVLAHEIGHIKHNDFAVMTIAAFVPMLAYMLMQSMFFSSVGNRNQGSMLMLIGFLSFFAYFTSEFIMLALSRAREHYADAYSAEATKKPGDLANALAKITYKLSFVDKPSSGVDRSLYIADWSSAKSDIIEIKKHADEIRSILPNIDIEELEKRAKEEVSGARGMFNIFSTHPPTYKRILLLAQMQKERSYL